MGSGATISVVTRSGTRNFHGSAAFYKRDDDWNGNEYQRRILCTQGQTGQCDPPLYTFDNAAWTIGLDDKIGSLVAGKNADVVLWSGNPFSVYSRAEKVWIDGAMLFDRLDLTNRWRTDFELGYVAPPGGAR